MIRLSITLLYVYMIPIRKTYIQSENYEKNKENAWNTSIFLSIVNTPSTKLLTSEPDIHITVTGNSRYISFRCILKSLNMIREVYKRIVGEPKLIFTDSVYIEL